MPLTSGQRIRQRIQDFPRLADAVYIGDGVATRHLLPHVNLSSASAYVNVGTPPTGWSGTGATFNASGYVDFAGPVAALSAFRVTYVHSVFDDAVLDEYLSAEGSIGGAALQCAYDLQFDALKRAKWRAPDGAEYDDVDAMKMLKEIIDAIRREQNDEAVYGGGFQSWAVTQEEV